MSDCVVAARPYRHHIALRLTYYEAGVIDEFLRDLEMPAGAYKEDRAAFNRVKKKFELAANVECPLSPWEREMEKTLATVREGNDE